MFNCKACGIAAGVCLKVIWHVFDNVQNETNADRKADTRGKPVQLNKTQGKLFFFYLLAFPINRTVKYKIMIQLEEEIEKY